jgi:MFS family permease
LSSLSRPAISSATAESVQADRHGSAFSLTMVAWLVPGVIAPTLGGWVTERLGYAGIFPILLTFEAASLLLVWRFLRETRPTRDPIRWCDFVRALARSLVPPKGLRAFFIATAGDSFAWSLGWGLINGMLLKTYGFTVEQLGIMASVMSLSWAVMQMPIGRYVDKHGLKWIMVLSESFGIPLMLIGMTQHRFEIFVAAQMLFALTAATWVPVVNTYLARAVPASARSEAFGRLNMFRGLIAFPASWLGGLLFDWGGIRAPLTGNLVGSCMVIAILILFVREPRINEPMSSIPNL